MRAAPSRPSDNLKVIKLCLATGASWGEVADLRREEVLAGRVTCTNAISADVTHAHFVPDYLRDAVRFNPLEDPLDMAEPAPHAELDLLRLSAKGIEPMVE